MKYDKNKRTNVRELGIGGENTQFPMYVVGLFADMVYLDFEDNVSDMWEEREEDVFPMPLNEELFIRNGFIKSQQDAFDIYETEDENVFIRTIQGINEYFVSVNLEDLRIVEHNSIQYVHELQNIFTLTGLDFDFKV